MFSGPETQQTACPRATQPGQAITILPRQAAHLDSRRLVTHSSSLVSATTMFSPRTLLAYAALRKFNIPTHHVATSQTAPWSRSAQVQQRSNLVKHSTCRNRVYRQASMRCMTDPSWPWQTTLGCTIDSAIDRQSTVTVTRIYLNDTTVTVERVWNSVDPQNYGYGAYAVQLRAPTTSEDTSTSSAPTAASSSSTTTTSAAPTTVSDASTDATSAAISTGAVAGIAVGCVVAGIALIAAVFFVFRQQRRRWGGKPSELEATETLCDTKVQYVGDLRHDGDRRHGGYKEHDADPGRVASQELHDDPTTAGKQDVYEMRSDRATFELGAGPHDVHELRGSIPPAEMQG